MNSSTSPNSTSGKQIGKFSWFSLRPFWTWFKRICQEKPQCLIFLVLLFVVGLIFLTSDRGGMADFNPYSLETRSRRERTFFGSDTRFYLSEYEYRTPPLMQFLVDEGFVSPQPRREGHWIPFIRWNTKRRPGYLLLQRVFNTHDLPENPDDYVPWSLQHRECAELYWSEGFRLLRSKNKKDVITGAHLLYDCRKIENINEMRQSIELTKRNLKEYFEENDLTEWEVTID